jgi:hypothetical protein
MLEVLLAAPQAETTGVPAAAASFSAAERTERMMFW